MIRKRQRGARLSVVLAVATLLAVALSGLAVTQAARKKVAPRRPSVSHTVGSQQVPGDPATGQSQQPTPVEAQQPAPDLSVMLQSSVEGLNVTTLADGAMAVDLDGGFQHVAMATFDSEGQLVLTCVDDLASAEALLRSVAVSRAVVPDRQKKAGKKVAPKRRPVAAEER
jgi:hypothetical protein